MSIHSPIFYCLSRYRAAEKTLPLLGRTLAFPSQQRYNLASVSWMRSGVSSQLDMPETPHLGVSVLNIHRQFRLCQLSAFTRHLKPIYSLTLWEKSIVLNP